MISRLALCTCLAFATGCNSDDGISDADQDGFTLEQGDCNDANAGIFPGAAESCDDLDNNCNGQTDEGYDVDGDGYTTCNGDCRDNDPNSSPIASEVVDGLDNDCDGIPDNHTDQYDDDGDGFSEDQGDCNDEPELNGASIGPKAIEIAVNQDGNAEGIDNDCDGKIDEAILPCPEERDVGVGMSFAYAIDICHEVLGAGWDDTLEIDDQSRNILPNFGPITTNRGGDMMVLATGLALDPQGTGWVAPESGTSFPNSIAHPDPQGDPGNGCGFADESFVNDYTEMRITLDVPGNAKGFSFDFNFMSTEFPEFVCSAYDDTFLAWLDSAAFTGNVSFDENDNVVSINIGFFDECDPALGSTCLGEDNILGTGFENLGGTDGGGTGWLTTTAPVVPGEKAVLTFMIFDEGDHILDSLVLIDNFRWEVTEIDGPSTIEREHAPQIQYIRHDGNDAVISD